MAVIALDIGGTKVEGAVVAPDGSIKVSLRTLHGDRVGLAVVRKPPKWSAACSFRPKLLM